MTGNYLGLDPIKALVYSATINAVIIATAAVHHRTVEQSAGGDGWVHERTMEHLLGMGGMRDDDDCHGRLFRDPLPIAASPTD